MTDTRLARREDGGALSVVPTFAITLAQARERVKAMQEFVKEMMVDGVDFGRIQGIQKPTLLKPGAEKLCDIYGFQKTVEVTHRVEDWDQGFFMYEVKVTLTSNASGYVEAEGVGSCNRREKR